MPSQRFFVRIPTGEQLAVIIELPQNDPRFFAIFSHCFTCTKDLKAIVKISRLLAEKGIAVARFDFRGLGESTGEFADSNFETNMTDILSVSDWLSEHFQPPRLLIGLSLGGAAMMAVSRQIASASGIVTLAAPSGTRHLAEFLSQQSPEIETEGIGSVVIGGRQYRLKRQLLESLRNRDLEADIGAIRMHHLILHSPMDETVGFHHAETLIRISGGIKSMVTLDGSDHLLINRTEEVQFVADLIDLWSQRWR